MSFRRAKPDRRWRRLSPRAGLALCVVAGLVAASTRLPFIQDPLAEVRADAHAAIQALDAGDLAALDVQLAAHRGQADFAYFFTSKTTPRALGDALAAVAGESEDAPLKAGVDAHAYDVTLTDLAGTLGLATFGTGDRALPPSGRTTSSPRRRIPRCCTARRPVVQTMRGNAVPTRTLPTGPTCFCCCRAATGRPSSSKQSLTLTGSTTTTRATTRGPTRPSRMRGYAPAPTGHYLTDGILALTAALTANSEASAWAFTEFQPGTEEIDGSDYAIGKFTHYLLFEHRFPEGSDGESIGMTATLTALSSAIDATSGAADAEEASSASTSADDVGPMHDSSSSRPWPRN